MIFNVCKGSSITATISASVRYIYISTLLETLNNYAGLSLIIFIVIMGIGTITLNLLYSKLSGGMIMVNKTLTELTVGSILDAGSKKSFPCYICRENGGIPVSKMQRVQIPHPANFFTIKILSTNHRLIRYHNG